MAKAKSKTQRFSGEGNLMIVVVQGSWVYIGNTTRDGDMLIITNAWNIRVWGTTAGLGQLALTGEQKDTVLDQYGKVTVPMLSVVGMIQCKPDVWA